MYLLMHSHTCSHLYVCNNLRTSTSRTQVVSVATGKHHTLALTSAGEVWSFGNNRDGKLGCMNADAQPVPRK